MVFYPPFVQNLEKVQGDPERYSSLLNGGKGIRKVAPYIYRSNKPKPFLPPGKENTILKRAWGITSSKDKVKKTRGVIM